MKTKNMFKGVGGKFSEKNVVKSLIFCVVVFGLILIIPSITAQPSADYGGAPDNTINPNIEAYPGVLGQFPSLYNTNNARIPNRLGVHHFNITEEWLGNASASTTTTEIDANIVDLDFDDSNPAIVYFTDLTDFGGPPYPAMLIVPVHVAENADDVPRYLNVLIDQNRDGIWQNPASGIPEWVVVNKEINVTPNTTLITISDFALINTDNFWMRITLTRTKINETLFSSVGGWDGSFPFSGFNYGETEDYNMTANKSIFINYFITNGSKCKIRIVNWGPKNGVCGCACGQRTCRVGVVNTQWWAQFSVVQFSNNIENFRIRAGPAWYVHSKDKVSGLTLGPAGAMPPAIAGPAGPPVWFPWPGGPGSTWQDINFNCSPGVLPQNIGTVFFTARFDAKESKHWRASITVDRKDPNGTYIEETEAIPAIRTKPDDCKIRDEISDEIKDYGDYIYEVHQRADFLMPGEGSVFTPIGMLILTATALLLGAFLITRKQKQKPT